MTITLTAHSPYSLVSLDDSNTYYMSASDSLNVTINITGYSYYHASDGGRKDYSFTVTRQEPTDSDSTYGYGVEETITTHNPSHQDTTHVEYTVSFTIVEVGRPTIPTVSHGQVGITQETIQAGSSSSVVGIAKYQCSTDNGASWTDSAGGNFVVAAVGYASIRAVDNVGNASDSVAVDIEPPTQPTITVRPSPTLETHYWNNVPVTVTGVSTDNSGSLRGYQFSTDGSIWSDSTGSLQLSENGSHFCSCRAVDSSGNIGSAAVVTIQIDLTSPVIKTQPSAQLASDGKNIVVTWKATDTYSGISYSTLKYSANGGAYSTLQGASITNTSDAYSATFPIPAYGTACTFSVTATDWAGNQSSESTSAALSVPPDMVMDSVSVYPPGLMEQLDQEYMKVDVEFDQSAPMVKDNFTELRIVRSQSGGTGSTITLPDLIIDPSTIELDANGNLIPSATWKPAATPDHLCYIDIVPVSSGAGNKTWTYTFTPYFGSSHSVWTISAGQHLDVKLPNNQGKLLDLVIRDMNGNASTSPDFKIGHNGAVQVAFQGGDPDQDNWKVRIERVTQTTIQESAGGSYTFTSYTSLSGKSDIAYPYSDGYAELEVPISLFYGDNNIEVIWTEGSDAITQHSSIYDLVLQHDLSGSYTLTVNDGYGNQVADSAQGIICAPGQELAFSVGATNGADATGILWDFGDGTPLASGSSQTHRYHQDPSQMQSSITRTLELTLPTAETIPLSVVVQDTQIGELYESETWRGDHTIMGIVVIPSGMSLGITAGTTVSFQGDIGAGYGQGIVVNGLFVVDAGATLRAEAGQVQGWGAIVVEGTASIGSSGANATVIRDAERALAVDSGAAATLSDVTLTGNVIGLHVVGSQQVTVSGCIISANSLYGIKEDAGGRPTVQNSTIKGNFRNYYQWDGGLLTISQINALGNNVGNQGE